MTALAREIEQLTTRLAQLDDEVRRQSAELIESRQRYADLFELAPDAYLVTDGYGKIFEANRAAAGLFSVPQDFLVGKPLASFLPEGERSPFRRALIRVPRAGESRTLDVRVRARSGTILYVSATVAGVPGESGSTEALRWLLRDVTEQKQAEWELRTLNRELEQRVAERTAQLETANQQLEAIIGQMPAGVIVVEAPSRRVIFKNRHAEEIAGGSLFEPDQFPLLRSLGAGEVVADELVDFVRPDGERLTLEASSAPIRNAAGEIVAGVLTIADVSERERRERAEREFVTNAAHELRTPLAAITGAIEVLQGGAKESPERDLFLEHIEREADRLGRLARALLVLARSQTGDEAPSLQLVELCPLLDQIAAGVSMRSSVEKDVKCPPELAVLGNRDLIEQAVANLVQNAARHTVNGRILVAARSNGNGHVTIEVRDTGPGIAPDAQERIFERFYRAGDRDGDGFGLGLAIAKQAVEALGGRLEIESSAAAGTTARVSLRAAELTHA